MENFLYYVADKKSFLQIWAHLLKKSLMENFIFCAVLSMKGNQVLTAKDNHIKTRQLKFNRYCVT